MSEIKFACPSCQQHIACDTGYSGLEIACPACKAKMIVPQLPGTPPPAPVGAPPSMPPPPLPPPPSAAMGRTCTSCGAVVANDAVICTQCGTNLQTGQKIQHRPPAPGKPGAKKMVRRAAVADEDEPWYKTAYPYLLLLLAILGGLYFLGKSQPVAMLLFIGIWALFAFTVYCYTVYCAFKEEGAMWGVLCIIFWIAAAYFVLGKSENTNLKAMWGVNAILGLILIFT